MFVDFNSVSFWVQKAALLLAVQPPPSITNLRRHLRKPIVNGESWSKRRGAIHDSVAATKVSIMSATIHEATGPAQKYYF